MLPKMFYELLPYLYLSIGAGSGFVINSAIVFIGSFLLIVVGILVIGMRVSYRRKIKRVREQSLG